MRLIEWYRRAPERQRVIVHAGVGGIVGTLISPLAPDTVPWYVLACIGVCIFTWVFRED